MPIASLLFAHGAGLPSTSPWMEAWTARLATLGPCVPFDYPYVREGRKRPDRGPKLIAAHREALASLRAHHPAPHVLIGKSMGSRMGCHLALEEPVAALICLGYPLVGINGKVRDAVLLELRRPILFVQGTRDRMCPLEHLQQVRARMQTPSEVHIVEEGDHSLKITKRHTKRTGIDQAASDGAALDAIRAFLERHARGM